MFDNKKAEIMKDFVGAFANNNFEKVKSLCTDDFVWYTPMKKVNGLDDLENYFQWIADTVEGCKVTETGAGIMVKGDTAFFEHTISGRMQGEDVSFLAICIYEFDGDKIKECRTTFDRMAIAEQASSSWLPKKLVNTIVNQMQKGLD